jgi:enterochelin esterase-like enzyme
MTLKRPQGPPGTVVTLEHASRVLADNPLGDPHVRKLSLWLPPQYDQGLRQGRGRRFPVLFDLVGFTGSGAAHLNWKPFEENVAEQAARLVFERKMGPAIIVFPDCFTRLGGNQYINSGAIGRYADYLTRELVPFVDREFRTLASRDHRGCFGKSSGGYGSLIHGMRYAQHWGAVADHSGDSFDFATAPTGNTLDELAKYRARAQGRRGRGAPHRTRRRLRARRRTCAPIPGSFRQAPQAITGRGALHHESVHGGLV